MHKLFDALKEWALNVFSDLENALKPGIAYLEQNGGVLALNLAEAVLAGFTGAEPWSVIIAEFVKQAESQGIVLAEGAASAVLNAAKLNIVAKGVPQQLPNTVATPVTPEKDLQLSDPDYLSVIPMMPERDVGGVGYVVTNPDHPDFGKAIE